MFCAFSACEYDYSVQRLFCGVYFSLIKQKIMHTTSKEMQGEDNIASFMLKQRYPLVLEYVFYFVLFLFVFGAMIPRFGYHWDETLDFCGGGMETYIANGRWGLYAWKYVFGFGLGTWTAGLLVGLFAAAAVMCQQRILELKSGISRVIYALAFMCLPQTAYSMSYSIQSDAVMFGVFATSLAVYCITQPGWSKGFIAALLVALSVGIYQSLALNFVVIVALAVLVGIIKQKEGVFSLMCKGVAVLFAAMLIWFCLDKASVHVLSVPEGIMHQYKSGQSAMTNHGGIVDLFTLTMYLLHYGKVVLQTALWPDSYPGELVYASAIIPVSLLTWYVWTRGKLNGFARLFANALLVFLWLSPFLMILVMGNEWPCRPHTRLAEPVVFAALWGMVISCFLQKSLLRWVVLLLGVVAVIRGSMHVSHYAAVERAEFELRLYSLLRMEEEAVVVAHANKITPQKGNILYFRKITDGDAVRYSYADFCGQYPALRFLRYGNRPEEIEMHREALQTMPSYPQEGSIRVNNGVVIICGETM